MAYFSNEWAVILGGSSGMGLACAKKLAEEGMHLCIIHRDRRQATARLQEEVQRMQESGIQCLTFNIDALRLEKRKEVVEQMKERLGNNQKIKLLLHSISRGNLKGLAPKVSSKEASGLLTLTDLQATAEAMALSLYDWVRDLFCAQLFASDARVLGLTSEGSRKAWPGYAAVSVAKASLEALCRSIALEYAPYGIRCNVLQPGVTDTPSLRMIPGSEQMIEHTLKRNPFGRLTRPEDVANLVYLMCRKEAAWINGAIIPVDGGERVV